MVGPNYLIATKTPTLYERTMISLILYTKEPVINSSRGGGGRHLGRGTNNSAHSEGGGMKNKEYFEWSMEFLLKPWSGDQNFYKKSERGDENSIKYTRMSSTPSPM